MDYPKFNVSKQNQESTPMQWFGSGLQIRVRSWKLFIISQPKHYVEGTQKNGLNEMVLLSTPKQMFKLMDKKIL